eukprot:7744887-Pyramimonas_sp.AAC.2
MTEENFAKNGLFPDDITVDPSTGALFVTNAVGLNPNRKTRNAGAVQICRITDEVDCDPEEDVQTRDYEAFCHPTVSARPEIAYDSYGDIDRSVYPLEEDVQPFGSAKSEPLIQSGSKVMEEDVQTCDCEAFCHPTESLVEDSDWPPWDGCDGAVLTVGWLRRRRADRGMVATASC